MGQFLVTDSHLLSVTQVTPYKDVGPLERVTAVPCVHIRGDTCPSVHPTLTTSCTCTCPPDTNSHSHARTHAHVPCT